MIFRSQMAQLTKQTPRTRTVGVTLPNRIWQEIDKKRGDILVSKYFLRLAEKDLGLTPIMQAVNAGYWGNEEEEEQRKK